MGASGPFTLSVFLVAIAVEYSPSSFTLDTFLFACLPQQDKKYRQRPDFNSEMYLAWLTGMVNAQGLIELDGVHPDREDWVLIAKRSICLVLGIPEPKYVKPKNKTKRK